VRDFLRRENGTLWGVELVKHRFRISSARALKLISELEAKSLIEFHDRIRSEKYWRVTAKGGTFSLASAARALHRKTAEQKLQQLLERVKRVNQSEEFIYGVSKVAVFGSYLTNRPRINDIDVAVEYVRKHADSEEHLRAADQRLRVAWENGRRLDIIADRVLWPRMEVSLFLKSRSRAISLHEFDELSSLDTEYEIIYELNPVRGRDNK